MNDTIGVIGLGTMGIGIAGHLLDEGCTVKGYDINPERLRILAEKGGIPASSPHRLPKTAVRWYSWSLMGNRS